MKHYKVLKIGTNGLQKLKEGPNVIVSEDAVLEQAIAEWTRLGWRVMNIIPASPGDRTFGWRNYDVYLEYGD